MFRRMLFSGALLASLVVSAAEPPDWWAYSGATDGGPPADNAAVNQGQLKRFTQKAVEELNSRIPGGAGAELNELVAGWVQAYESGGYNAGNPLPADFSAMTSGQLKWIASKIHARLVFAKYEDAPPAWIVRNAATELQLVNLGQLKTVFNFDLTAPAGELPLWWRKFYFNGRTNVEPNEDADDDGLTNIQELISRTNPGDPDTDHDGLTDKWEMDHNLDPTDDGTRDINNGPAGDPDGDGDTNFAEQAHNTDPQGNATTTDSDGDGLLDSEDAVPGDPLINWKKADEGSYVMIDIDAPSDSGQAEDLNDKGEVLFDNGIWASGNWIEKTAPDGTGAVPGEGGAEYDSEHVRNWFFNTNRQILGELKLTFTTTASAGSDPLGVPSFWPTAQNSPSLIYDTADMWDNYSWNYWPIGVSDSGSMAINMRRIKGPDEDTPAKFRIERFDASGASAGIMDGTSDFHPDGQWQHNAISASGWVASNLVREAKEATETAPAVTAAQKVGLWDDSNNPIPLPAEANGWGYPVRLADLPGGKVGLVAGQWPNGIHQGRVFLPDSAGNYQHATSLAQDKIQLLAGDGTGVTSDGKLWRNGKLIPLHDLSSKYKDLEDGGYTMFPLKANTNGAYLIQADKEDSPSVTKLLMPGELEIWNGLNAASPVPEGEKYSVGAFTIANLNDTDGDGGANHTPDKDDNEVTGEKDLMQLKAAGYAGMTGKVKLTVKSGKDRVKFWEAKEKKTAIPLDENGAVFFDIPVGGLDKTVWIEATAASGTVRDIEIWEGYQDAQGNLQDGLAKVKATAIWVTHKETRNLNSDSMWSDASQDLKDTVVREEITPFGESFDKLLLAGQQSIGFKFEVQPHDMANEPGIRFDVTRQINYQYWVRNSAGTFVDADNAAWPSIDTANDDARNSDEDNIPENNYLFSVDAPGLPFNTTFPEPVAQQNFHEFVRVWFKADELNGNNNEGSRCSDKYDWHSFYWWVFTPSAQNPNFNAYKRKPGAPATSNQIGPGHGIISQPQP